MRFGKFTIHIFGVSLPEEPGDREVYRSPHHLLFHSKEKQMFRNRWGHRLLLAGSILALSSGLQSVASAQVDGGAGSYDWLNDAQHGNGYLAHLGGTWRVNVNGLNKDFGGAGIFNGNTNITNNSVTTTVSNVSVCADLFGYIGQPDPASVTTYNVSQLTPAKLPSNPTSVIPQGAIANKNAVNFLLDNLLGKTGSNFTTVTNFLGSNGYAALNTSTDINVRAAAFQTAIWELWYDNAAGNVGAGTFNVLLTGSGDLNTIKSMANAYVAAAQGLGGSYQTGTSWYLRDAFDNDSPQGQLVSTLNAPAIPEPAFYQMAGLLTLGFVGARRVRKARKA